MAPDTSFYDKLIGASDPYAKPASIVGGFRYKPYEAGDEKTALGVAAGQVILQGILEGKGKQYRTTQKRELGDILSDLYNDPVGTARPEGLDEEIFASARNEVISDLIKEKRAQEALKNELILKNETEFLYDQPEAKAGLLAKYKLGGDKARSYGSLPDDVYSDKELGAKESPAARKQGDVVSRAEELYRQNRDTMSYDDALAFAQKEEDRRIQKEGDVFSRASSLRTEFSRREAPQKFEYMSLNLPAFVEAYLDKDPVSDYELIRKGAQAVEPGLAVRRDDEQSIIKAASLFGTSVQTMKSLIFGESRLTDSQRAGLARTVQRNYDSAARAYNSDRTKYSKLFELDNLGAERFPFQEGRVFADLYPKLDITGEEQVIPYTQSNLQKAIAAKRRRQLSRGID